MTYQTAYTPFTPNNSEQRLLLPYYRAAGTELAGAFFEGTVKYGTYLNPYNSSLLTGVYDSRAFILHAALLVQTFAH